MTTDISYQNYDIVFKDAFSIFQDRALDFLGIRLPKIQYVLDGKLPEITAREQRFDLLFALEDGSILHLEEEVDLSKRDLLRFASYDLHLYAKYGRKIHTIVLCREAHGAQTKQFDSGVMRYEITAYTIGAKDGDAVLREIKRQIAAGETVNPLELIFLPLMKSQRDSKAQVQEIVRTALALAVESELKKKIVVSVLVMSDKLVEREFLEGIWEEIHMYKFIEFAEEKGMKKGLEQGLEQGLEKGLAIGMEKGLEKGLEKGMEKSRIAILAKLLAKKFKVVPRNYMEAIEKLDGVRAECILDDIFKINCLEDLHPYLADVLKPEL